MHTAWPTGLRRAAATLAVAAMAFTTLGTVPASAAPVSTDLPTLNITLADTDTSRNTLSYVHASKDNKVPTTMTLEDPTGAFSIATPVAGEIKGRGNYTWSLPKKPYQIKFADNTGVLGMASSKTWVLLANAADASLMRTKVAFEFADKIGLPYTPESRWIDLRVNDQYLGNYLMSEKTEVKKNRVELKHDQGVLVELDNNYGLSEDYNFRTSTSNTLFVLKEAKSDVPKLSEGPLPAATLAGWNDVKNTLNRVDQLLAAPTVDWAALSAIIDVDSFVKFYWVYELAANPELSQSSIYFYKDGPDSKLFAGPVWDFDSSMGNYDRAPQFGSNPITDYAKSISIIRNQGNGWYHQLFRTQQFYDRAQALWNQSIKNEALLMPAKISAWEAQLNKSAANNFSRWRVLGQPTFLVAGLGKTYHPTYAGEVGYLRDWIKARVTMLTKEAAAPQLQYQGRVGSVGWQNKVNTGQVAGTVGQARQLEQLTLASPGSSVLNSIQATVHIQDIGWTGWGSAASMGSATPGKRLEALGLRLTGSLANQYDISYRVHVQETGWQDWKVNSVMAGTEGQSKRIEAIQIRLLAKSGVTFPALPPTPAPTPTPTATATPTPTPTPTATATPTPTPSASPTPSPTPTVPQTLTVRTSYTGNVQDYGWSKVYENGGTLGVQGKRLEAIKLKVASPQVAGNISYRGHVQNIGWQPYVNMSSYIGTQGQSLRLEAFDAKLTGDLATKFDLRYRAYVRGIGWQPWVSNGAMAGTVGQLRQIEQVQIEAVPKG